MRDAVRLDADAFALQVRKLLPFDRAVEDALRRQMLLVRERMTVVEIADRNEQHRRVAVLAQHAGGIVEVVVVAVVEGDQHSSVGQRLAVDVVAEHRIEIDHRVVEVAQLVHLLVEDRHRHRQRIAGQVVHLVVHEHAQAPLAVAVGADRGRRLADRPVDGVLQHLLEAVCAHRDLA